MSTDESSPGVREETPVISLSRKKRAREMFAQVWANWEPGLGSPRQICLRRFRTELGLSEATADTYYVEFRKEQQA